MNKQLFISKLMFCFAIFYFFILSCHAQQEDSGSNKQSQSEFMKLVSNRPVPDIETLAKAFPGIVIVDEAYGEFAEYSFVPYF